ISCILCVSFGLLIFACGHQFFPCNAVQSFSPSCRIALSLGDRFIFLLFLLTLYSNDILILLLFSLSLLSNN
ncbi:hypothetical protein KI387_004826, partial [Taxus chinensis]